MQLLAWLLSLLASPSSPFLAALGFEGPANDPDG